MKGEVLSLIVMQDILKLSPLDLRSLSFTSHKWLDAVANFGQKVEINTNDISMLKFRFPKPTYDLVHTVKIKLTFGFKVLREWVSAQLMEIVLSKFRNVKYLLINSAIEKEIIQEMCRMCSEGKLNLKGLTLNVDYKTQEDAFTFLQYHNLDYLKLRFSLGSDYKAIFTKFLQQIVSGSPNIKKLKLFVPSWDGNWMRAEECGHLINKLYKLTSLRLSNLMFLNLRNCLPIRLDQLTIKSFKDEKVQEVNYIYLAEKTKIVGYPGIKYRLGNLGFLNRVRHLTVQNMTRVFLEIINSNDTQLLTLNLTHPSYEIPKFVWNSVFLVDFHLEASSAKLIEMECPNLSHFHLILHCSPGQLPEISIKSNKMIKLLYECKDVCNVIRPVCHYSFAKPTVFELCSTNKSNYIVVDWKEMTGYTTQAGDYSDCAFPRIKTLMLSGSQMTKDVEKLQDIYPLLTSLRVSIDVQAYLNRSVVWPSLLRSICLFNMTINTEQIIPSSNLQHLEKLIFEECSIEQEILSLNGPQLVKLTLVDCDYRKDKCYVDSSSIRYLEIVGKKYKSLKVDCPLIQQININNPGSDLEAVMINGKADKNAIPSTIQIIVKVVTNSFLGENITSKSLQSFKPIRLVLDYSLWKERQPADASIQNNNIQSLTLINFNNGKELSIISSSVETLNIFWEKCHTFICKTPSVCTWRMYAEQAHTPRAVVSMPNLKSYMSPNHYSSWPWWMKICITSLNGIPNNTTYSKCILQ
eukprot:TRINITY_DN5225_c0_g1_i2.p1 TRINITY_DN5225_c0_g1~~TRINITY_DN5225_c0_g1_i2.p1  ORF type:complete len:749 (-),score=87.56 TRINITY_DN5225_c0_g1_i2:180-2426(-)